MIQALVSNTDGSEVTHIGLSPEPGQRSKLIRSPPLVKHVVFNVAPTQPGTHHKI